MDQAILSVDNLRSVENGTTDRTQTGNIQMWVLKRTWNEIKDEGKK